LGINKQGSFILSVKNPEDPIKPGQKAQTLRVSEETKERYPEALQSLFGAARFISVKTPELLDYPGTELIFIGAEGNVLEELSHESADVAAEFEGFELRELKRFDEESVFKELHLSHQENPSSALHGEWK
jgi:hypothetical protein